MGKVSGKGVDEGFLWTTPAFTRNIPSWGKRPAKRDRVPASNFNRVRLHKRFFARGDIETRLLIIRPAWDGGPH